MKRGTTRFFAYARERHRIYLNRAAGECRPWTGDPVLRRYRFTNVFRELDKNTVWFRENVRDRLSHRPTVLLATVVFRWLNRIETGEAVFLQRDLLTQRTAFEEFARYGGGRALSAAIRTFVGSKGPYVTGAYIISTPAGYSKLDGACRMIENFNSSSGWFRVAKVLLRQSKQRRARSLEETWNWLREQPYMGPFHAYEVVTDLRHTALLSGASDICTWANPGPGARRGLNRVHGRELDDKSVGRQPMILEMQELLRYSGHSDCWPDEWQKWEMREVEHTLCEFDKYERARLGEGRPRGTFSAEEAA